MDAYAGFAEVYDLFMDNVPYEEWKEHICELLAEYGIKEGLLLDLGCGTGTMTRLLAKEGFDMIGVDVSPEMLEIARDKEPENSSVLYLCQDMRSFELYGTVGAVVSVCDAMNYLLTEEDLIQVIRLVNNYLDPDGIFLFDLNTVYKYEELLGDATIAENREEGSFIWENDYDRNTHLNEYDMTFFIKEKELYRKYEEVHVQRAYSLAEIEKAIAAGGMKLEKILDAQTLQAPVRGTERVYVIAREQGKNTNVENLKNESRKN